jgi:hypothetical protein
MQWSSEIYHYEVTPPPGIWERIDFELDNNVSGIRSTLKNFKEDPPAIVWSTLKQELNNEIKDSRLAWYKRPVRMIAAASLTGLIFLAFYLANKQDSFKPADFATSIHPAESTLTEPTRKLPAEIARTPQTISIPESVKEDADQFEHNTSSVPDNDKAEYKWNPEHSKVPVLATLNVDIKPVLMSVPQIIPEKRDYSRMQAVQFHDGNYIQIISPDGSVKRVSYKLKEMVPAIKDDFENPQLKHWKEKMQSAAFIPSNINFFDIADMVRLLEEQK